MTILEDRIPTLLERVDLVELVARYAGPATHIAGDVVTFRCPHPDHPDTTPSFTVTLSDRRWHCWSRCGRHGDALELLVWLTGTSRAAAIEQLARDVGLERGGRPGPGVTPLRRGPALAAPRRPVSRGGGRPIGGVPYNAWERVREFVDARAWHPAIVDELAIRPAMRYLPKVRDERLVVRFPFRVDGDDASYVDRQLGRGEPKWLNAKGEIPCPYEGDRIRLAHDRGEVLVVEGVSDTAAIVSSFPDAAVIGCPGAGIFKERWAAALAGLRVVVVADNDDAGELLRALVVGRCAGVARVVEHLYVPAAFHDVDEWRRAHVLAGDEERWADELVQAVADASGITCRTAP